MGSSFEQFVERHGEGLLRTAYLIVWDSGDAEDIVQECLLRLARQWRRVALLDEPLLYARRIVINLAADDARARSRRRLELDPALIPTVESVEDPAGMLADRAEVLSALALLSARQRAVLVLRYFNDLSETQVAEILGCSPGTVKSSASRGLARLHEALQLPTPEPCEEPT
jgi:RNA polymerase sigma-70 factor (sigma-E family)